MVKSVDLFDDPNLSFSKLAAVWLLNLDPRMLIGGFSKRLCEAVEKSNSRCDSGELKLLLSNYRIIPDAYLIDQQAKTAYLFEVEDTNPLSADKLRKLSEIWWRLDSIGWEMRVFLIDRYLTCWRSLSLVDVWHSLESPFPDHSGSVRMGHSVALKIDWEATHQQALAAAINRPIPIHE